MYICTTNLFIIIVVFSVAFRLNDSWHKFSARSATANL